jgi:hypothetical protein
LLCYLTCFLSLPEIGEEAFIFFLMKHTQLILLAVMAIGCSIARANAQDTTRIPSQEPAPPVKTDSLPAKTHVKRSHLEIGMNYQSNDVYLGRKDSARLPYFIPSISYYHKSGLFVSASLDYLKTAQISRIDLFTLDAGYMFTAHKYDGALTVSKYFYNSQSTNITSDIRAAIAYQNSYDFGFIKPGFTATLNIGSKVDFEGLFELSHTFLLFNDDLDITPTFAAGASTLNFYDYYRRRKYTIQKKNKPKQTGIANVTGSVIHASTFQLMDYEPTMPIEYSIGKLTLSLTPTWSIPVNPATIDVHTVRDNGTTLNRTTTEKIGNTFYFTAGASIMF